MVAAKRLFEGHLPLSGMSRLMPVLADAEGDCRFGLEFGVDPLGLRYVDVRAEAQLPLLCQRSLERFLHPVRIEQRLGLVTDESQEAALPEGVEPLLLDASGELDPASLVEDELILAVPVVPIDPASADLLATWPGDDDEEDKPNPFAALAALKGQKKQ